MNIRGLLTLRETAKILKYPRDKIMRLIEKGELESEICTGTGTTRIPLKSIEGLIKSGQF
ncbi:MAG: helix-turn-helix domain-containing protein [Desulfomonilaceae bacterium]